MEKTGISVLHLAPEAAPFSKVGGLGDVTGSLPRSLVKLGVDCRLAIPAWGDTLSKAKKDGMALRKIPGNLEITLGGRLYSGRVYRCEAGSVTVYLISQDELFSGPIYPWDVREETVRPYAFAAYGALMIPVLTGWEPDIYHCHDWTTAFLPMALRWHPWFSGQGQIRKTVFTVHNLAHQGMLPQDSMEGLQISRKAFVSENLEFYGMLNLMKGAIVAADHVTTVSPTYALEVQTPQGGRGLDGLLRSCGFKLSGILNGLDDRTFNPAADPALPAPFSAEKPEGKKKARAALLERSGLSGDGPVAVMISRLVEQKGLDILLPVMKGLADKGIRIIVIGSGESRYQDWLSALERESPDMIRFFGGFHDELGRLAYGGADLYLMPSLFEPCGLSQLIAMRYGTVPVVRSVGGLADTVRDLSLDGGWGVVFQGYDPGELYRAVLRAVSYLEGPDKDAIVRRAMTADFSWKKSAPLYRDIYMSLKGV